MKEASKGVREKKRSPPDAVTLSILYSRERKIKEREIWNKWSSNEKTIVLPLFYSITYGNNKKPSDYTRDPVKWSVNAEIIPEGSVDPRFGGDEILVLIDGLLILYQKEV